MRRAQQDASIASLLCVRQKKNDRERERKDGVTESENGIRVRPLGFLPQHALHFSLPEGGGHWTVQSRSLDFVRRS